MKTQKFTRHPMRNMLFIISLLLFSPLMARQANDAPADTTKRVIRTIRSSAIPGESGDAINQADKLAKSLITEEELDELTLKNVRLNAEIDSIILAEKSISLANMNIRGLNNRLIFWNNLQTRITSEMEGLMNIIQQIESSEKDMMDDREVWIKTKKVLEEKDESATVLEAISMVIQRMDSVLGLFNEKQDFVWHLINRSTKTSMNLQYIIELIDDTIIERESEIFAADQPSVLKQNYGSPDKWRIAPALRYFYKMEWKELIRYLNNRIPNVVFQILLLVFLIIGFTALISKINSHDIDYSSTYKKMLKRILSRPWSAGLILGLFASTLIFTNRPLIFKDLAVLIVTIPIILIVNSVLLKKYHKYIYAFGLLVFLQLAYFIFHAEHIIYQLGICFIAIIEIIVLLMLLGEIKKIRIKKIFVKNLIYVLVIFQLGTAFLGLIGIIAGMTLLAEISVGLPITNTFAFLLLIISALIINGLTELAVDSKALRKINVFRLHGAYLKTKLTGIINLIAIVVWLFIILKKLNLDRPLIEGLTAFFEKEWSIGLASFTVGSVFIFFLVIWLSVFVSKVIRIVLEEDVLENLNLAKGVPRTISVMVRYTLITLGIILAVSAAGMPLTSLTVIFGAISIGIGFGLQNIFNNLVSGLILLFERPIQIGDTIEVGTLIGNVKSMGIRSSHVKTFDGAEIIVPNGHLISNEVVNWTLSDQRRRIEVIAGVAYGTDPHLVQKLLLDLLKKHKDILQDPEPSVFFQAMGESSLDFRLLFWTAKFDEWVRIRSEVTFGVHDILVENNIEIPFPQRDLHIRSIDQGLKIDK